MTNYSITNPFPIFTDNDGTPLEAGYIYIGEANQNPITNPISVFYDIDGLYPAAQPIRTLAGYPARNGTPGNIYINLEVGDQFSILIQNKNRELIYSSNSANLNYFLNQSKLQQIFGIANLKWFGATMDGTTDDTLAVTNAEASSYDSILVPDGIALTTFANYNSLNKKYYGIGQIETVAGNLPFFYSHMTARPTSLGNHGSLLTAFDGDLSGSIFQIGQSIQGDVLSEPATGYVFTYEAAIEYKFTTISNTAGHNESNDDDTGRTGYIQNKANILHQGQGDAIVNHASVTVTNTNSSSTHFLANPAGVLYGGSLNAAADLTNLTVGEITLYDNGYDCRGTGFVFGFKRDNNTPTKYNFWNGQRLASTGTYDCDAGYQVVGKWKIGLDCTPASISQVAIALAPEQKIEFHAASTTDPAGVKRYADTINNWDMYYNTSLNAIRIRTAGVETLRLTSTQVIVPGTGHSLVVSATSGLIVNGGSATFSGGPINLTGGNLNITGYVLSIGGQQVVEGRQTGWTAATGTADRTTFATSTVTLSELAERVKALIDDLISHGLIGA